jgi:hypothetical protein
MFSRDNLNNFGTDRWSAGGLAVIYQDVVPAGAKEPESADEHCLSGLEPSMNSVQIEQRIKNRGKNRAIAMSDNRYYVKCPNFL